MRCEYCGDFDLWGHHKCPPKWYCIHAEDYGNGVFPPIEYMIDEGDKIYARDAEQAAIKFAERYQASSSCYPSEMTVLVMDYKEKSIWKYIVNQELVPSYSVSFMYEPEIVEAKYENEEKENE